MPSGSSIEHYTQNWVSLQSFSQNAASHALAAALNSQDILLSQLYYGVVSDELDTSQPYADFAQVKLIPNDKGNVDYVFINNVGQRIPSMRLATSTDFDANGNLVIGTGQADVYDIATGQITRAAASTDPWFNRRGLLVIKPTEGAALVQKNEELGRASNVIQILASLISAQQSARSAWVNALR